MTQVSSSVQQKNLIIKLRKNIKEKLMALKLNKSENDREFKETYAPLINPLNTFVQNVNNKKSTSSKNNLQTKQEHLNNYKIKSNKIKYEKDDTDAQIESENDEFEDTFETFNQTSDEVQLNKLQTHVLNTQNPKNNKTYDHVFGRSYNPNTKQLMLGAEGVIEIQDNDIILNGTRFNGTSGLYNLLFLKDPKQFTKQDNNQYVSMLKLSKAIYLNNNPSMRIKGNTSKKYMETIRPYFIEKEGKGMKFLKVDNKPYRAIYWDEVNELIDRLVLLHASKTAGNNSVLNEIIAIEEELREARIIY